MASAVLASRNEPCWGERKVYMRKFCDVATVANASNNRNPFLNVDPNPAPRPPSKHINQVHDPSSNVFPRQREASPLLDMASRIRRPPALVVSKESIHGGYVTFRLGAYTRRDVKELKRRLVSELEQVRVLRTRLEGISSDSRPVYPPSQFSATRPLHLNVATNPTNPSPQIRTPKNAQTKKSSPGLSAKRSNPFAKNPSPKPLGADPLMSKVLSSMMKRCGQILTKVMKHRHAWIFGKPVDVEGLGLFDYHQIIKKPMDLGTVKLNLDKGFYKSPMDYAADVRLTFDNAITYNPKGHEIHILAQLLLGQFNEMFNPAHAKFEKERVRVCGQNPFPVESSQGVVNKSSVQPEVVERKVVQAAVSRGGKLPKPKARDPNKRAMNFEEKSKLGKDLEKLPAEKMTQLLQIVKKRNGNLSQDGDEIELDMEVMDTETLWELDRFVNNHKKVLYKMRRQAVVPNNQNEPAQIDQIHAPVIENVEDVGQKVVAEEDVDIGEDIPAPNYPSVEIEKDVTACASGRSRSSSSGSSSGSDSSSSDSDSGSSSGSDSEAGSVQSPYVEAAKGVDITS